MVRQDKQGLWLNFSNNESAFQILIWMPLDLAFYVGIIVDCCFYNIYFFTKLILHYSLSLDTSQPHGLGSVGPILSQVGMDYNVE